MRIIGFQSKSNSLLQPDRCGMSFRKNKDEVRRKARGHRLQSKRVQTKERRVEEGFVELKERKAEVNSS